MGIADPPLRSAQRLRPPLFWGLLMTLALTAWALWGLESLPSSPPAQRPSAAAHQAPIASAPVYWPARHAKLSLVGWFPESSGFDPFVGVPTPPAVMPAARAPAVNTSPAVGPPPVAPAPPTMSYRYFGRMRSPDGQLQVYLANRDRTVAAISGQALDDGWSVLAVTASDVQLQHGSSGAIASVPLPLEGAP